MSDTTAPTARADEAAIRALIDAAEKGHNAKDPAAILANTAPDAVIFDLAPPLRSEIGTDSARLQAWLDTWEGPVGRQAKDLQITVGGDVAFAHGFYRLSGRPKSADEQVSLWMRVTLGLRRIGGRWQLVHEHTSVPFLMDGSFRAATGLEP